MNDIGRILVPTDFSRGARQALWHAVVLADRLGAELHVLHVDVEAAVSPEAPTDSKGNALLAEMRSEVRRYHSGLMERKHTGDLPARFVVHQHTDPADAILEYARERQVDLIVMDQYGDLDDSSPTAEGTAQKVARNAPCKVLASGLRGYYGSSGWKDEVQPIRHRPRKHAIPIGRIGDVREPIETR